MKEILKGISLTTIIISYLFVCGSLYLIGYWGTFPIDISNFIQIWDIPKSFILPFTVAIGLTLFFELIRYILYDEYIKLRKQIEERKKLEEETKRLEIELYGEKEQKPVLPKKSYYLLILVKGLISPDALLTFAVFGIGYAYHQNDTNPIFWAVSGFIIFSFALYKLNGIDKIKQLIPKLFFRLLLIEIVVATPCLSFTLGKVKSVNVYNNTEIMYAKAINSSTINASEDTSIMKFLGFLGDKAIISSLDNNKIVVLNETSFEGLELIKKK